MIKTIGRLNKAHGGRLADVEISESVLASLPPEEHGFTFVSKINGLPVELKSKFNMIYIPNGSIRD